MQIEVDCKEPTAHEIVSRGELSLEKPMSTLESIVIGGGWTNRDRGR
jgi:hypothetical protein